MIDPEKRPTVRETCLALLPEALAQHGILEKRVRGVTLIVTYIPDPEADPDRVELSSVHVYEPVPNVAPTDIAHRAVRMVVNQMERAQAHHPRPLQTPALIRPGSPGKKLR